MPTIDDQQSRTFLEALGSDQAWRLIRVDDRHHRPGEPGFWLEDAHDIGRTPAQAAGLLACADDRFSWHVRPMPLAGPWRLTMLDDANRETIGRMITDGLAPTAVVETSPDRYQVWHRWPWAMVRTDAKRLLQHLQIHYRTDPGANMPGHTGRLPGTKNWKRDPHKHIDRRGYPTCLLRVGASITQDQAEDWLSRFPMLEPSLEPPITVKTGRVGALDFDDPRYLRMVQRQVPLLPGVWAQAYAQTQDASQADMKMAIRGVSLQLDDAALARLLDPLVHQPGRKVHGAGYIAHTIAKARQWTDVQAPGVWGPRFDGIRQFPWLGNRHRFAER